MGRSRGLMTLTRSVHTGTHTRSPTYTHPHAQAWHSACTTAGARAGQITSAPQPSQHACARAPARVGARTRTRRYATTAHLRISRISSTAIQWAVRGNLTCASECPSRVSRIPSGLFSAPLCIRCGRGIPRAPKARASGLSPGPPGLSPGRLRLSAVSNARLRFVATARMRPPCCPQWQ